MAVAVNKLILYVVMFLLKFIFVYNELKWKAVDSCLMFVGFHCITEKKYDV